MDFSQAGNIRVLFDLCGGWLKLKTRMARVKKEVAQ